MKFTVVIADMLNILQLLRLKIKEYTLQRFSFKSFGMKVEWSFLS